MNKRKKQCLKRDNAITLIALVVTIIILIILAGVSFNLLLGENGIVKRAQSAELKYRQAQYYEEINLAIHEEQIERAENSKTEPFITSLSNKILTKDWVNSIIKCDDTFEEKEDDEKNSIMLIQTKDQYELVIDVNNTTLQAKIREDSFGEIKEKSIITYDANNGTGSIKTQEVKTGFYAKLQKNSFTKENYNFVGWCEDKEGNGIKYAAESKYKVEGNTTLYAIWKQDTIKIIFDSNGGTGTMDAIEVEKDVETTIPSNEFTRTDYIFKEWNTKADGTGESYTDKVTTSTNITLYAIWKKDTVKVTFDSNGGIGTMADIVIEKGVETNLPTNTFTKTDYWFVKWNTKPDGTGITYTSKINVNTDTTLYAIWSNQLINITSASVHLLSSINVKDVDSVKNVLFDGNTNNGGQYKGVFLATEKAYSVDVPSFITFTVDETITIYANGNEYVDHNGTSGADLIIEKHNGTSYQYYKTVSTDASGNRYELVTLPKGDYKIKAAGDYVSFDEWAITPAWDYNKVTIGFNENTGTGKMNWIEVEKGVNTTLPTNTFHKPGRILESWNTKPDGTGISYTDTINVDTDTILYVIWSDEIINITSAKVYSIASSAETNVTTIKNVLFDGNTKNGGTYQGIMVFDNGSLFMNFTVSTPITIYAYGHVYQDSGGKSGANVIFKKHNGTSYQSYKTVATNTSGNRYELVTLEAGNYQMLGAGRYVNFDEWEIEPVL